MITEIDGKSVIITGKLVSKFVQPVFYNEKQNVYYYVIESPTTLRDEDERYILKKEVPVGTPYFSLNYALVENILLKGEVLFVQIKSPDLPYIKGGLLTRESLTDTDVHIGRETSKYKTSGNYMFALGGMKTIKEL